MPFHLGISKKPAADEEVIAEELGGQAKHRHNLDIQLNSAPGHVFRDLETVSGNCVLVCTRDEDLGSVSITFQGLLKANTSYTNINPNSNAPPVTHDSLERVLFTEEKTLYEGKTILKKNTQYSWPFEFQFPCVELPSLHLSGGGGSATVEYTLKAALSKSWQNPEDVSKRLNAMNNMNHLPFQPNKLFEKLGAHFGLVSTTTLQAVPRQDQQPDMSLRHCVSHHDFHSGISSLMHGHEPYNPANGFSIDVQLPRSLIRGYPLPVVITVNSDVADPPAAVMRSISIYLVTLITIGNTSGRHNNKSQDRIGLLEMYRQDLPLPFGSPVELGKMVGCKFNEQVFSNIETDLLFLAYNISMDIVIECGGKNYKGKHEIDNVKVY